MIKMEEGRRGQEMGGREERGGKGGERWKGRKERTRREGRWGGREEMGGRKKALASYTAKDAWKLLHMKTKKLHACVVSFHFMLSHFFIKMALFMMELLWMPFIPTP